MNNKRKEKVRKKLLKIRAAKIDRDKNQRILFRLEREAKKMTNIHIPMKRDQHLVGDSVRVDTGDIPVGTSVYYHVYEKNGTARNVSAKVVEPNVLSVISSIEDNYVIVKIKHGKMFVKKDSEKDFISIVG